MSGMRAIPVDVTAPEAVLCLGWDVGGWHGERDGVAALLLHPDGTITRVGRTGCHALGPVIAASALSLEHLAALAGVAHLVPRAARIVVGIDAPLAFPRAFAEVVSGPPEAVRTPFGGVPFGRFIDNPLAFRHTDRVVFAETGKLPLSPALDSLTNNATKARAAAAQLRARTPAEVSVLPFTPDGACVAMLEVYPALWKPFRSRQAAPAALRELLDAYYAVADEDERDALLCALVAASYEATRTGRAGCWLPRVRCPKATDPVTEGWIYFPIPPGDHRQHSPPSPPRDARRSRARTQGRTTAVGYVNRNHQEVLGPGPHPGASVLACRQCGARYVAHNFDVFQRCCPTCQGGAPGGPITP